METEAAPAPDSATPATSSVKDEGGTASPDGGRGSPPPNCAICLGQCQNKSFTDSCLHQFCFTCLLTWSKIKAECPLCKQNFKSIIHNVRSNHQYEEYLVEQREAESLVVEEPPFPGLLDYSRRFRYRTTITIPRSDSTALQHLLLGPVPRYLEDVALPPQPPPQPPVTRRQHFRTTVYRHNLWARQLPDFTGRFRECTPEFYRNNESQKFRLMPWIVRELDYLLSSSQVSFVIANILELLPVYPITSPEFRDALLPYLRDRTEHFLHELYCFASTPYDLLGYDRHVQYGVDPRQPFHGHINEVISSSDSESADSDIVMITSSEPAVPYINPSSSSGAVPVYPPTYIPNTGISNVIPIETISHSDSDDSSSEVMVVGYIKPPQDRTPEVVDLLASDSDVVLQENSPDASTSAQIEQPERPLVKLTLKRRAAQPALIDTDSDYVPDEDEWHVRTQNSASTVSTRRGTHSSEATFSSMKPAASSSDERYRLPDAERRHLRRDKIKLEKLQKERSKKYRKKIKRRHRSHSLRSPAFDPRYPGLNRSCEQVDDTTRSYTPPLEEIPQPVVKSNHVPTKKRKSSSGKEVKSSKHRRTENEAGTSGTQRSNEERPDRECRKLRSVVCAVQSKPSETRSESSSYASPAENNKHTIDNILGNNCETTALERTSVEDQSTDRQEPSSSNSRLLQHTRYKRIRIPESSDSDDDLPLNLTVKRN